MNTHPNFHRARKDACPDIAKVRCPDCGAKLHFDAAKVQRQSYGAARPVNAIGGPPTQTPRGVR